MFNITRRNPLREMVTLQRAMDRWLDNTLTGSELDWPQVNTWELPLDVVENEDEYVVKASIPGIKPEDLEITYNGNTLTIKGETKEEKEEKAEQYHLRERRVGVFTRSITLPTNVDANKIQADYDSGVLTLHLPKAEEAKPKRIQIQSGQTKVLEGTSRSSGNSK